MTSCTEQDLSLALESCNRDQHPLLVWPVCGHVWRAEEEELHEHQSNSVPRVISLAFVQGRVGLQEGV